MQQVATCGINCYYVVCANHEQIILIKLYFPIFYIVCFASSLLTEPASAQERADEVLARMDSVARVLSSIDGEIRGLSLQKQKLEDSLNALEAAIVRQSVVAAALDSQYRILEAERQPLLKILSRSVLADMRLGRWAMLDILLGSQNLADYLSRRSAMTRLRETAKRRAVQTARGLIEIHALEDESLNQVKLLSENRSRVEEVIVTLAQREVELAGARQSARTKRDLLVKQQSALEKSSKLIAEQVREKETSLRQVASMVESEASKTRTDGTFISLKGLLPWPTESSVASRFGKKTHRTLETVTENPGIDLRTEAGSPVRSVASGIVTTVTWLRGFGHLCIVQHEGDHHTVYARMSEVLVRQGDVIDSSTIIGYPGFDPERNFYGLHFEVWSGKDKQDPIAWLAPAKKQP